MKHNWPLFLVPTAILVGSFVFLGQQFLLPPRPAQTPFSQTPKKPHQKSADAIQVADETHEIVIGQSANFSNGMRLYAETIQLGIQACFASINNKGGINGKKLRLETLNDGGDPQITEQNILAMMKKGIKIFLGNMGSRNLLKILPLIKQGKILMLFPWGGDTELRDPGMRHLINGPGLLKPQIEALVAYIKENVRHRTLAIYHSDDAFSRTALHDALAILDQAQITPVSTTAFNRLTLDVATSAVNILASNPKIVLCLGTSVPTVKLINAFFEHGAYTTSFFGIDSTFFVPEILAGKGVKFYYSSAVPDPQETLIPIAREYREALEGFAPEEQPNILSFTYFICAKIMALALEKDSQLESIIQYIESMQHYDLGGFDVTFDKENRHAFGTSISIIRGES